MGLGLRGKERCREVKRIGKMLYGYEPVDPRFNLKAAGNMGIIRRRFKGVKMWVNYER